MNIKCLDNCLESITTPEVVATVGMADSLCCCSLTALMDGRCLPHLITFKEAGNLAGYILIVTPLRPIIS